MNDYDRLKKLSNEINDIRQEEAIEKAKVDAAERDATNMNSGVRAGAELVTFIIAGTAIGYGLDRAFESAPLFLVIFLLAGMGLGFYEVYRITK
jgi:ATP synthase protein I